MKPSYDCQPINLSAADRIRRGDRVSWRLPHDDRPRGHGRVVRRTIKDSQPAFSVNDDDGTPRIIPARFITKEGTD